ncbi:MAG: hypothetical protein AAB482_00130 [Patescibacteria group bacterium]
MQKLKRIYQNKWLRLGLVLIILLLITNWAMNTSRAIEWRSEESRPDIQNIIYYLIRFDEIIGTFLTIYTTWKIYFTEDRHAFVLFMGGFLAVAWLFLLEWMLTFYALSISSWL